MKSYFPHRIGEGARIHKRECLSLHQQSPKRVRDRRGARRAVRRARVSGRGGRNPRRARPEPPHRGGRRNITTGMAAGCGGEGHAHLKPAAPALQRAGPQVRGQDRGHPFLRTEALAGGVTPHPDVASGNFVQAEFFRRTYITEGLRHLLVGALKRLSFGARDPVSELQTNFGGGKTHSLLAQTCALRSRSTLDAH